MEEEIRVPTADDIAQVIADALAPVHIDASSIEVSDAELDELMGHDAHPSSNNSFAQLLETLIAQCAQLKKAAVACKQAGQQAAAVCMCPMLTVHRIPNSQFKF